MPGPKLGAKESILHPVVSESAHRTWSSPALRRRPRRGLPRDRPNPTYLASAAGRAGAPRCRAWLAGLGNELGGRRSTSVTSSDRDQPGDHRCSASRVSSDKTSAEAALPGDITGRR